MAINSKLPESECVRSRTTALRRFNSSNTGVNLGSPGVVSGIIETRYRVTARALRAGHSLAAGMHVVAEEMPSAADIAANRWLPDSELAVYAAEYERSGRGRELEVAEGMRTD